MTQKLRLAAAGAKTSLATAATALKDREVQTWYLGVAAYLAAMFMSGNLLGEVWHRFA
jgi:hypothetical protein